jgi:hypothetical protein
MTKKTRKRNDIISASEIGQYVYCSIAWKLQRNGYIPKSPFLEIGRKAHVDIGNIIDNIQVEINRSKRFEYFGYLFLSLTPIFILIRVIL